VLSSIQARFSTLMASQLGNELGDLIKIAVPKWSSYGVLALKCNTSPDTVQWIAKAMQSRFEGLTVPFCYPDNLFGPDVVFLMWTSSYEDFRFVASQIKLKRNLSQVEAPRTVWPRDRFTFYCAIGDSASADGVDSIAQGTGYPH
jgi:hypothetical protein